MAKLNKTGKLHKITRDTVTYNELINASLDYVREMNFDIGDKIEYIDQISKQKLNGIVVTLPAQPGQSTKYVRPTNIELFANNAFFELPIIDRVSETYNVGPYAGERADINRSDIGSQFKDFTTDLIKHPIKTINTVLGGPNAIQS